MEPTLAEASSLQTPPARLRALAELSVEHQRAVAGNAAAPADLLLKLSANYTLRPAIAQNPATPAPLLWDLACYHAPQVIDNPVFQLLLLDYPDITAIPARAQVALLSTGRMSARWQEWVFDAAIRQNGSWVLHQMASMSHTLPALLARMSAFGWLVPVLLRNPSLPAEVLARISASPDPVALAHFASSSHATPGWLSVMATVREDAIRAAVARHAHTPPATLERLARDAHDGVRWGALGNNGAPLHLVLSAVGEKAPGRRRPTVEPLAQRHGGFLCEVLRSSDGQRAGHAGGLKRALSQAARPAVMKRAARQIVSPEALEQLARSRCWEVRMLTAQNPATAPSTLAKLATDRRHEVRRAVAGHPATPDRVREALGADPVAVVRKTASTPH